MLSWFSGNKEVTEFARQLAVNLSKRYPPALDLNPEKKISANRLTKVLEDTLATAAGFQREHKLGLFGKLLALLLAFKKIILIALGVGGMALVNFFRGRARGKVNLDK